MASEAVAPLALTEVGRRLELEIGTPQGRLLKSLALDPRAAPIRRHGPKLVIAVCFLTYLARKWRMWLEAARAAQAAARERLMLQKAYNATPEGLFKQGEAHHEDPNAGLRPSLWELVASPDGSKGYKLLFCSAFASFCAGFLMMRKAFILGRLMALQNEAQNWVEWRWYAWQFPLNAAATTLLQELAYNIQRRAALTWRRNVTTRIHDLYFSHMGYYHLQNQSGPSNIWDADIRFASDIKNMCDANSGVYFSICNATIYTVLFGSAVIRGRDWKWSLLTPTFFATALSLIFAAEEWDSERHHAHWEQSESESRYTQLLTNVQLHAERICMLQGERYEATKLRELVDRMTAASKRIRWAYFMRDLVDRVFFNLGWPNWNEQMGWFMAAVMGANDVIWGANEAGHGHLIPHDPKMPHWWSAGHLGGQITNLWSFFNTCSGWSTFTTAYFTLKNVEYGNYRVTELYGSLKSLQATREAALDRSFLEDGSTISFDGITVQTPSKVELLRNLSFRVEQGDMLLICGHNGAGKSSIIRCLCGLWPVETGTITRPGGSIQAEEDMRLHQEMYYLPQKPCNVLGTLSDQLTYPEHRELPEEELRRWLRYVDLEYLADRRVGSDSNSRVKIQDIRLAGTPKSADESQEMDWEVLLSLGEQQALSIARLLYHHPRFAILDECTSAVGKVLERRLFEICRELGISCITITHRPALKELHGRMLQLTGNLHEDQQGWHLSDLHSQFPPLRSRPEDEAEVHQRIEAYLARQRQAGVGSAFAGADTTERELTELRSRPYAEKGSGAVVPQEAETLVHKRWRSSIARLLAVLQLVRPETRRSAGRRLLALAVLLRVRLFFGWMIWRAQAGMTAAAICGDLPLVLSEMAANVFTTLAVGSMEILFTTSMWNLTSDLWSSVSHELLDRAMLHATFLKVMNPPGPEVPAVENPIQRLTELRMLFDTIANKVCDVALPMCNAVFLFPTMIRGVGWWAPLLMIGNYVLFRGVARLAPDFGRIQARESTLESRFQVLHTRLRGIAEPVAFSGAGAAERRIIEPRFAAIVNYAFWALRQQFWYDAVVNFFTDYGHLPVWTHRLLSLRYSRFNNPESNQGEGMTPNNVVANLLWDRGTNYGQIFIQRCVMFVPDWKRIDACCTRMLEMVVAFEAAERLSEGTRELPSSPETVSSVYAEWDHEASTPGDIAVRGLDLVTQRGVCLASDVAFELHAGEPMLVTGPNATGKSLLGSILLGLWAGEGRDAEVLVPGAKGQRPPLRSIMPAPQRIYLRSGLLCENIAYPLVMDTARDCGPPFRLFAHGLAPETGEASLMEHFGPMGAYGAQLASKGSEPEVYCGFIYFFRWDWLIWPLARPQDRWIDNVEVKVDFGAFGDLQREAWATGTAPPRTPLALPNLTRMRRCLRAAGIEHILLREDYGWLTEKPWEDSLSGGEQQRLCFARVLYHKPDYALLDECTSMVAADAEEGLYRMLSKEWGITPLTLTQRMFMPDLYAKELSLGVKNAEGWSLASLQPAARDPKPEEAVAAEPVIVADLDSALVSDVPQEEQEQRTKAGKGLASSGSLSQLARGLASRFYGGVFGSRR